MKSFFLVLILSATLSGTSIYDFKVPGLDAGSTIDFALYKGKKIMIVNTASFCGNTPQYKDLESLYEKYKDKLVIVGFPANNFGTQEPGTNEEIKTFCQTKFNVAFPLFAKISVKGDDIHPLYQFLTSNAGAVTWNFNKFLIGRDGKIIRHFESKDKPEGEAVISAIEQALK